jgi:hypothetical protein
MQRNPLFLQRFTHTGLCVIGSRTEQEILKHFRLCDLLWIRFEGGVCEDKVIEKRLYTFYHQGPHSWETLQFLSPAPQGILEQETRW